jgi:excisionase family DNA binding protein
MISDQLKAEMLADGAMPVDEAERFAGVKRSFLYERMSNGELPFTKCGARRLIPKKALVEMLARGLVGAGAE